MGIRYILQQVSITAGGDMFRIKVKDSLELVTALVEGPQNLGSMVWRIYMSQIVNGTSMNVKLYEGGEMIMRFKYFEDLFYNISTSKSCCKEVKEIKFDEQESVLSIYLVGTGLGKEAV